jgi:GDP-L-fucose synthase
MPTNLYGPNDNFDLETSHVFPALIRKFHLAKLANKGDWEAIKRDQHEHGTIPEEMKRSMGLRTSPSNLKTTTSSTRPFVPLWGSGCPRREFLHVDDLADSCIFLAQMNQQAFDRFFDHTRTPLINIGCGEDQTVRELATIIAEIVGYQGDVRWDQNKPDGTSQKLLDISKIKQLGWKPKITLKDGIRNVYKWYVKITDEGS